jgi:hypothetical protein
MDLTKRCVPISKWESAMIDSLIDMVRQRLREKRDQVYCADCLAKDSSKPVEVRAAMAELAVRQDFMAGGCPCGGTGLAYRW